MISNTNCYIEHVGDGELKVFNFGFPAENVSEIKCKVADKSGGVAELQSTEYSVTLNDSNSYVTLTVPLPAGNILRIYRKTAITQELEFDDGVINNSDICKSMDKLTRISQEISNSIERISLIGPQGEKGDKGEKGERGEQGAQGETGASNTLTIGEVIAGSSALATITGEAPNQVLNLTLPKGDRGEQGPVGAQGVQGLTGAKGDSGGDNFAIGNVICSAHYNSVPSGWLYCDGSAISRTDYAALFDVIGTAYGEGDGSTTFNLPSMRLYDVVSFKYEKAAVKNPHTNAITSAPYEYRIFGTGEVEAFGQTIEITDTGAQNIPEIYADDVGTRYTLNVTPLTETTPISGAATGQFIVRPVISSSTNTIGRFEIKNTSGVATKYSWYLRGKAVNPGYASNIPNLSWLIKAKETIPTPKYLKFSKTNYIKLFGQDGTSTALKSIDNAEYYISFVTGSNIQQAQMIFDVEKVCYFFIFAGVLACWNAAENKQHIIKSDIKSNTKYEMKCAVNSAKERTWYLKNGDTWEQIDTDTDATGIDPANADEIAVGNVSGTGMQPFLGYIDWNSIVIKHNGTTVFNAANMVDGTTFTATGLMESVNLLI